MDRKLEAHGAVCAGTETLRFHPAYSRVGEEKLEGLPDPEGGRWTEVNWGYQLRNGTWWIEPGPRYFPQLLPRRARARKYGRPLLERANPDRVEFVVRAVDIFGFSRREVARRLGMSSIHDENALAQTRRDIHAGRRHLLARGVLPWAAFAKGALPDDWWHHESFAWAVDLWRSQAVLAPADRPPTLREQLAPILDPLSPTWEQLQEQLRAWRPMPRAERDALLAEVDRTPWQPAAPEL